MTFHSDYSAGVRPNPLVHPTRKRPRADDQARTARMAYRGGQVYVPFRPVSVIHLTKCATNGVQPPAEIQP